MIRQLPPSFEQRMEDMLQSGYPLFRRTYEQPAWQGLRMNPLKIETDRFMNIQPFSLHPVPWCETGFYYADGDRPGKHSYHAAGLYYLQEPSAMSVADALNAKPGDKVLDLCAAPGGKSTQIAGKLQGQGLLIANEIHPVRAKALSENIERLGITNAIVTNETPERLAERFPLFFDRILVDAPCSGEGMFRKLPEAVDDWSEEKVTECHLMQTDILESATAMLKPGGMLVYSTCTFAPLENEVTISQFLDRHPEFELLPLPHAKLFAPGEAQWAQTDRDLSLTARLWPHLLQGEGHFLAALQKKQVADEQHSEQTSYRPSKGKKGKRTTPKEALQLWNDFAKESCPSLLARLNDSNSFLLFGDNLYYSPAADLDLDGMKIVRPGWHLGTLKKNRFEPSHALALALSSSDANRIATFFADEELLLRYLRGESVNAEGENGWTLVTVDGYSLGWAKQVNGTLKNHYPKGLRWL